jgi:hypothetical protein
MQGCKWSHFAICRRVTFQEMVLQTGSEFKARVLGAEFRAQTLRSFGLMRAYVTRT